MNPGLKSTIGFRPRRNYRLCWKNVRNGTEDQLRTTRRLLAAGLLCMAALGATSKPDFSGTWKLNNGKSAQDGPADRVFTETIAQSKDKITVKSEGETNVLDGTFPLKETFRIEHQSNKYRATRAYWETGTLVFELKDTDSKKDTAKVLYYIRESWTLSRDGKVLTRFRRTMEPPKVATEKPIITDQKYVFDKQ
jgi:hypothetical protein